MRNIHSRPSDGTAASGVTPVAIPLAQAPVGARARLLNLPGSAEEQCATLGAMGVTPDEVLVVHQSGEPTIVSLGAWDGRRIGLSQKIARGLLVVIEQ